FYSEPRAWLAGDSNFDGTVTTGDFAMLASNFNGTGKTWMTGDYNGDGRANALDFNALVSNFGQASPVPATALTAVVPAPGAWQIGCSVLLFLRRTRRSREIVVQPLATRS